MMSIPQLPESIPPAETALAPAPAPAPPALPPSPPEEPSSTMTDVLPEATPLFGVTPPTTPGFTVTPQETSSIPRPRTTTTTPQSGLKQPRGRRQNTPNSNSKGANSKATAQRVRDTRLPTARTGSVFDRLYKTQTAASRAWAPARQQARKVNTRTPQKSVDDELKVFARLHVTGTVSNSSKRFTNHHGSKHPTSIRFTPEKNKSLTPAKTPTRTPLSKRTPLSATRNGRASYVYSPRMKCLTKLYFNSKYHPGLGMETVEPLKLGYSFFQAFCEYENGNLDSQQIAREIIAAFFKKDFPAGRHWELHEPSVEARPGEVNSYNVKMSATYDWQDGYRVASARGVVRCKPEKREVVVLNYLYDVKETR